MIQVTNQLSLIKASEVLVFMESMNRNAVLSLAQSQMMCSDQETDADKVIYK